MIDQTAQTGPNSGPYIEPVLAPPPPATKPPTLATLLAQAIETDKHVARTERTQEIILAALCLVLVVIVAEAVMIGVLLGRMVR